MSFLSVLHTIFNVFDKAKAVNTSLAPVINAVPGGAAFEVIFNTVVTVEQMIASMLGANAVSTPALSAAKKAMATAIVAANPATASLAPEVVSTGIDQTVANLNALQATQAHIAAPVAGQVNP